MRKIVLLLVIAFLTGFFSSCSDDFGEQNTDKQAFQPGSGVFIVNEGNWGQGNGSLSFYSFDDGKVYTGIFMNTNNRPLGDLPAYMTLGNDFGLITVNNTGSLEVIDPNTMKSKFSITGLNSPRQVHIVDNQTVLVSHLADSSLSIINPSTGVLKGKIHLGLSSEAMLQLGNYLYVSNWSRFYIESDNRIVLRVNLQSAEVEDTIHVGLEPQSMVTDRLGRLWVLCSGGWDNSEFPSLHCISGWGGQSTKVFTFPDKNTSPTHLCINGSGDTLYFLNQSIYRMGINDMALPTQAFINNGSSYFYALAVDPKGKGIMVSEPLDFQQNGIVRHFDMQGVEVKNFRAGIIPGSFCFN